MPYAHIDGFMSRAVAQREFRRSKSSFIRDVDDAFERDDKEFLKHFRVLLNDRTSIDGPDATKEALLNAQARQPRWFIEKSFLETRYWEPPEAGDSANARDPDNRPAMLLKAIDENWDKPRSIIDREQAETIRRRQTQIDKKQQEEESQISAAKKLRAKRKRRLLEEWARLSDDRRMEVIQNAADNQSSKMISDLVRRELPEAPAMVGPTMQLVPAKGRTGVLTENRLHRGNAFDAIRRRARQAGIATEICPHTFRATGITNYLTNSGQL